MKDKDIIVARAEELKRYEAIKKTIEKKITQNLAAEMLEISPRQVRRIAKRIKEEGISGVTHRLRGAPSKRSLSVSFKEKIVSLYRQRYYGFGPTFATEKLFEINEIKISDETLRLLLIKEGLWQAKKKRFKRRLRLRKEHRGEMLQMDGSEHFWFEDRGPKATLMGYIDDATGRVFARFYEYEGTIPAMDSFGRYAEKYGLPLSVYFDRHSAYSSKKKLTIEEELAGIKPNTQFSRALGELKVKTIEAHSPQAKGRIERAFKTFQDRLVKELRLSNISNIKSANDFLEEYLDSHNSKFEVSPTKEEDLHMKLHLSKKDLRRILCIRKSHILRNDFTVFHDRKIYQALENTNAKKVTVEEHTDGKIYILYGSKKLKYIEIKIRPKIYKEIKVKKQRQVYVPKKSHPWRRSYGKDWLNPIKVQ